MFIRYWCVKIRFTTQFPQADMVRKYHLPEVKIVSTRFGVITQMHFLLQYCLEFKGTHLNLIPNTLDIYVVREDYRVVILIILAFY